MHIQWKTFSISILIVIVLIFVLKHCTSGRSIYMLGQSSTFSCYSCRNSVAFYVIFWILVMSKKRSSSQNVWAMISFLSTYRNKHQNSWFHDHAKWLVTNNVHVRFALTTPKLFNTIRPKSVVFFTHMTTIRCPKT